MHQLASDRVVLDLSSFELQQEVVSKETAVGQHQVILHLEIRHAVLCLLGVLSFLIDCLPNSFDNWLQFGVDHFHRLLEFLKNDVHFWLVSLDYFLKDFRVQH